LPPPVPIWIALFSTAPIPNRSGAPVTTAYMT
jgi:hypothetical protein